MHFYFSNMNIHKTLHKLVKMSAAFVLAAALAVGTVPAAVFAQETVADAEQTYVFDAATGTLTVFSDEGSVRWRNSVAPSAVKHIVVGGDVNNISTSAFRDTAVVDVNILHGVMYIGKFAFRDCTSLTAISLPATMASVQPSAFLGCTALSSITLAGSMGIPEWIGNMLARGTETEPRRYVICIPTTATATYTKAVNDLMNKVKNTLIAVTTAPASPYYGSVALADYDADPAAYTAFVSHTLGEIAGAPLNSTVHIETTVFHSFPDSVLRALNDRTDVTLKVTYQELNGEKKTFYIPPEYNALRVFGNGTGYVDFTMMYMRL